MTMDTNENINHQALTEALLDEQGLMPDAAAEWKRMTRRQDTDRRKRKQFYLRGLVSGIAASAVLILLVYLLWPRQHHDQSPLVAYTALPTSGQVTWQSGDDQPVLLTAGEESVAVSVLSHGGDSLAVDFLTAGVEAAQQQVAAEMQVITTPPGCSVSVTLPDSSIVWLNGNSRLVFPSFFADDCRRVQLQGEAYFKAAHDAQRPLYVETQHLTTRVLGTEFYVSSADEVVSRVALVEGSVEVSVPSGNLVSRLVPDQSLQYNTADGSCSIAEIDVMQYLCMRDGYFYFDDVTLRDVMTELGRWYNVNVVFEDEELLDLKMRFFFRRHDTVEQSVALLNNLRRIHAKVVDETIFIK